jgi:Glutamine amidotransferase
MVTVLDCGFGNLKSVQKAFEHLGEEVLVTQHPKDIEKASSLVFPGQGAFDQAMAFLDQHNLRHILCDYIKSNRPFLGICLGFPSVV